MKIWLFFRRVSYAIIVGHSSSSKEFIALAWDGLFNRFLLLSVSQVGRLLFVFVPVIIVTGTEGEGKSKRLSGHLNRNGGECLSMWTLPPV